MAEDIVKRLRLWEEVFPEDVDKPEGSLYEEAADEVERLRELLWASEKDTLEAELYAFELERRGNKPDTLPQDLDLECDGDGIWLTLNARKEKFQLGHVPWVVVSAYLKEYL